MNYNITTTPVFDKELKRLAKKYRSLGSDILFLKENIEKELTLADDLGDGFRKVRLNIKSKGKGKSGGGRIITYETIVSIDNTEVIFAVIYDKSEFGTVDISVIKDIISDL
ncbi:MAG: toxin [Flavobacteriaceae bacterium]